VPRPLAFRGTLALIALAALAVRTAATFRHRDYPVIGDALTFHLEGGHLAHGEGFRRIFEDVPTAEHPPLFIVLLAAFTLFGAGGILAQQLLLGVVGTVTVVLVGLLGRRVAGDRAGLIAAAVAAVHPLLWLADGALMSESLYGPFVVAALLAACAYAGTRTAARAALVGALVGLAALTRGEALLLVPLLALATLVRAPLPGRVRLAHLGALVAAFAVVLAPWSIRNALTFDAPVLISANADGVWAGANCERTYYGPIVGSWDFPCYGRRPAGDEAEQSRAYRRRGMRYMRDHLSRVPVVLAARVGRVWDVYRPDQNRVFAASEGRPARSEQLGVLLYWLLLPFALAGAWLLRRHGHVLAILLAPAVMVTLTALLSYGSTRFRFAAEPSIVVLAAVAADALLRRWWRRPRPLP
jgi:4-amino-4-deoxy-L-arabinose transferase-like glycosyltransferase